MKRKTNIKQHYIPQYYLRYFTNDEGQLSIYDKNIEKQYLSTPLNECNKKFFYDIKLNISSQLIKGNIHEEIVDDKIRVLNEESSAILIKYLQTLIDVEHNFKFEREEQDKLHNFIILQMIRTPFYRDRLKYLCLPFCLKMKLDSDMDEKDILAEIHNLLLYGVLDRLYNLNILFEKLYYRFFNHLIDEILYIKKQLELAGKLFLLNKTNKEFISSDSINFSWENNPLAHIKALITPLVDELNVFDIGYYLKFNTVYLPLSSDIAIFFFDKIYATSLLPFNQGIGIINDNNSDLITNLNLSTLLKCQNKIYSSRGDYDEIIQMKNNRINPRFEFRFR